MSEILFKCPHCSKDIFMRESGTYSSFECPHCNNTIQPPSAAPASATTTPQKPKLSCPSCNAEMQTNAVICTSCGLDLRTGQKIATSTIGLGIKKETESMPESIFSRFGMKPNLTWQDIQRRQRLANVYAATISLILYVLLPILILAGISYFVDLGKSESKDWKKAKSALSTLKANPKDKAALQEIKDTIPKLGNGLTSRTPKTGLTIVWALGQINLGNVAVGKNACKRIEEKNINPKLCVLLSESNFTRTCSKCEGKDPAPVCSTCNGSGKITFRQSHELRKPGSPTTQIGNERPLTSACTECNGTGKRTSAKCSKCAGKHLEIAPELLHAHYISVLKKVYAYAMVKYIFEKIVDAEIYVHELLSGKHAESSGSEPTESASQPETNTENLLTDQDEQEIRLDKLCKEIATKFSPPKPGELITLKPDGGTPMSGILVNITESAVDIQSKDGKATITLQRAQLDAESRARCFRNDYADFHARKAVSNGKAPTSSNIPFNKE